MGSSSVIELPLLPLRDVVVYPPYGAALVCRAGKID